MVSDTEEGPDPDNEHHQTARGSKYKREGIAIELTPGQIDRVIHGAAGTGNMSALLSGQIDGQEMLAHESELLDDPHISTSLMRGLLIIAAMHGDERYIGVVELANKLDMSQSTTHRYLATLVRAGLVERDASSRKYRLAR